MKHPDHSTPAEGIRLRELADSLGANQANDAQGIQPQQTMQLCIKQHEVGLHNFMHKHHMPVMVYCLSTKILVFVLCFRLFLGLLEALGL